MSANGFAGNASWLFIVVGLIFLACGARDVVTRQGRSRGKSGRVTHYSGKDAVISGCIGMILGATMVAVGVVELY